MCPTDETGCCGGAESAVVVECGSGLTGGIDTEPDATATADETAALAEGALVIVAVVSARPVDAEIVVSAAGLDAGAAMALADPAVIPDTRNADCGPESAFDGVAVEPAGDVGVAAEGSTAADESGCRSTVFATGAPGLTCAAVASAEALVGEDTDADEPDPVSAAATPDVLAAAHPTPSATASAPTRPTYFADVTLCAPGRRGRRGRRVVSVLHRWLATGHSPAVANFPAKPIYFREQHTCHREPAPAFRRNF